VPADPAKAPRVVRSAPTSFSLLLQRIWRGLEPLQILLQPVGYFFAKSICVTQLQSTGLPLAW